MTSASLHLLRIYTNRKSTRDGELYWKVLISRARAMGMANAAVLEVLDGFGRAAVVHGAKAVDLAPGSHVIVEIIDHEATLKTFHDTLEVTDDTGLVTLESINVVGYGGHRHSSHSEN